ncbi:MAG TPA: hypothetical protein VHX40_01635 [Acidimicrobiales bacterium]|jgi:hypothetical protein|nr:hypothetical protein [Acidimicrobiales bacterium]
MSDAPQAKEGTAGGLVQFLTFAGKKGLMAVRTAEAYKSAATRILEIDGEDWLNTDLRSIDVDMQVERFVRLHGTNVKLDTLHTYKSRFKSAVTEYLRYVNDPMSYREPTSQRSEKVRKAPRAEPKRQGTESSVSVSPRGADGSSAAQFEDRPNLVKYPFPLRSGQMAYFELPRDLSRAEAQRMAAFVASLAIDGYPELPMGKGREP